MKVAAVMLTLLLWMPWPTQAADPVAVSVEFAGAVEAWEVREANTLSVAFADEPERWGTGYALAALPPAPRPPGRPLVALQNGEVLAGEVVFHATGVTVELGEGGAAVLPLDALADVRFTGVGYPESAGDLPCVVTRNGDVVSGEIASVTEGGVTVASPFGEIRFGRSQLGALLFAPRPDSPARPADTWLVEFTNGSRVYADSIQPGTEAGSFRAVRDGQALPARRLSEAARLVAPGYDLLPLVEAGDRGVAGASLWLEGRRLPHGLRLSAPEEVMLPLSGEALAAMGWTGLDTHQGKAGNCEVTVTSGGTIRLETDGLDRDHGAVAFGGICSGGEELAVHVEEGARGAFGDVVNIHGWVLVPLEP